MKAIIKPAKVTALHRAMKAVIDQAPALISDGRDGALREVAHRLAADGVPGATLLVTADAATLQQVRSEVLRDSFQITTGGVTANGLNGERDPSNQTRRTALVSGGSYSGVLAAIALARAGNAVTLVEQRPEHMREARLALRQGTIDVLASIDPELAKAVLEKAHKLPAENLRMVNLPRSATAGVFRKIPGAGGGRAPDASQAPQDGTAMMQSPYTHIIIGRELEAILDAYAKQKFPRQIAFVEGRLHAEKTGANTLGFTVEKKDSQGNPVFKDFLAGKKPDVVIVAEGAGSSTRTALGINSARTTPTQYWTAGIVHTTDSETAPEEASMRVMFRETEGLTPTGEKEIVTTRAFAVSGGQGGTWLLTQMPPSLLAMEQSEINEHFFNVGSLVTGHTEAELVAAGAHGPVLREGSVPTGFAMAGNTVDEAARVLDDGTVIGFLGDAAITSTFMAGGGMNTAISEVASVITLAAELNSGVPADEAAKKFEESVFERGDAWSAAGIPYFYKWTIPSVTAKLVQAHLQSLKDWRKEGGPSPLKRLEAMLAQTSVATAPIGQRQSA